MDHDRLDAAKLFRCYAPVVARFLGGLGVRRQDREDLVQEVFLVAHRRGGFDPGAAQPFTWLAAIAFRIACATRRRRRRLRETFDDEALVRLHALAPNPSQALEAAETRDQVHAALDAMSTDKRVLLVSFELEGQACEIIAQDLGVPVGTVYSRLNKARKALAQILQRAPARAPQRRPTARLARHSPARSPLS